MLYENRILTSQFLKETLIVCVVLHEKALWPGPDVIKLFSMLIRYQNSENEIGRIMWTNCYTQSFQMTVGSPANFTGFIMFINLKMHTIVCILTFISRTNTTSRKYKSNMPVKKLYSTS